MKVMGLATCHTIRDRSTNAVLTRDRKMEKKIPSSFCNRTKQCDASPCLCASSEQRYRRPKQRPTFLLITIDCCGFIFLEGWDALKVQTRATTTDPRRPPRPTTVHQPATTTRVGIPINSFESYNDSMFESSCSRPSSTPLALVP